MFSEQKSRRIFLGGFLCGMLVLAAAAAALWFGLSKEQAILADVRKNAIMTDDLKTVREGKYRGMMAATGDPYATYYSEEEAQSMKQTTRGTFTGIGISFLTAEDGSITVNTVYPGSPADRGGVLAGDEVISINGLEPPDLSITELAEQIRSGSVKKVEIVLRREGEAEPVRVTLVPEEVDLFSVSSGMTDDGIGYIYITNFRDATGRQFADAYAELKENGMKGLIIDLRNDGGGLVQSAVDALNVFMPEGLLVYTVEKDGTRKDYSSEGKDPIEVPLAVLVNENTASASEIFAGAVQDTGTGKIVGTKTYGKGIVQSFFDLRDGSMIRMTTANYYTPGGTNLNGTGITPDMEVTAGDDPKEDPQFEAALDLVRSEDNS